MSCDPASRAGAIIEIDLAGIVENWRQLSRLAAPAECAAVVKANAYGLGAPEVARVLAAAGCRIFFVATLDEGIALRHALGGAAEIAVLNGPFPGTTAEFVEHDLMPVLNEPGQIEEWAKLHNVIGSAGVPPALPPPFPPPQAGEGQGGGGQDARGPMPPAILHIDTGMARLGLTACEFASFVASPPPIAWRAIMSHLACADQPEHSRNAAQRRRFAVAAAQLPGVPASLAASSGIFLGASYHFGLVRPGAALYGVNPQPGRPNPLRQIVRLSAQILQIRHIGRGEAVGYGATHIMSAPGRVATVALGYADGWLRSLSGRGCCGGVAGKRVPLIGRVSMDLVTFDVSAVPEGLVHPGAAIELLGEQYGIDDAAAHAGTIGYEILTALGRGRYHRVYRGCNVDAPHPALSPSGGEGRVRGNPAER
jgi:alanine racemase